MTIDTKFGTHLPLSQVILGTEVWSNMIHHLTTRGQNPKTLKMWLFLNFLPDCHQFDIMGTSNHHTVYVTQVFNLTFLSRSQRSNGVNSPSGRNYGTFLNCNDYWSQIKYTCTPWSGDLRYPSLVRSDLPFGLQGEGQILNSSKCHYS